MGLNDRGDEVYKSLIEGREVSAAHKAMALNAARMVDTLDRIEAEFLLDPRLTVINSQGTESPNPLITEQRMITGALSQILSKLGVAALPEVKKQGKSKRDELAERRDKRRAGIRGPDTQDSVQP